MTTLVRFSKWALVTCAVVAECGCAPTWNGGPTYHVINEAVIEGDHMVLSGLVSPIKAHTDYGVKVYECHDDAGRSLSFTGMELFWEKTLGIVLEFDRPSEGAKSVTFDIEFTGRGEPGFQRIVQTLPLRSSPYKFPIGPGRRLRANR